MRSANKDIKLHVICFSFSFLFFSLLDGERKKKIRTLRRSAVLLQGARRSTQNKKRKEKKGGQISL